jgi:DNA-binding SARP family transcriptional activator
VSGPFLGWPAALAEAQLRLDAGQEDEGLAALRRAMALGRERGYVNCHGWRSPVMARLCARALEAGIEVEYVKDLIRRRRLVPDPPALASEEWPWPVKVYTLGRFEVVRDGRPVTFAGKAQRRPLLLLKALIAFGGRAVREDRLIEVLWPDADGDAAQQALATTVFRLRKLLGDGRVLQRQEGQLGLDPRVCWVDAWAVEHLLGRAETPAEPNQNGNGRCEASRWIDQAAWLYRGPFLGGDSEAPWASSFGECLRRRLRRHLDELAAHWEVAGDGERAAQYYERALEVDPCAEDVARRLMTTYRGLGRRAESLVVYARCRAALAATHGVTPCQETDAVYAAQRSP